MKILLNCPSFTNGANIPVQFTCDGEDISLELSWSGIPESARSLALICNDPDAPVGNWVHWVLYNIPPQSAGLAQSVSSNKILSDGSIHGINSWNRYGYGGPCPPSGVHRYFFKLYALDIVLSNEPGLSRKQLEAAMSGHILAQGELMGTYSR